jgi:hypothetical protein
MAEDKWISVADAADFLGTSDATELIQRYWKLGTVRLYGVRPGESEPVGIPAGEAGTIDCIESRVGAGELFTTYHSVTIAWDDVERLAQADVERLLREAGQNPQAAEPLAQAAQTPPSAREGASNTDILEAKEGPLVKAVALALRRHFPEGRPHGLIRDKLAQYVHKNSGGKIDLFSPATLDRALALAWPRAKRSRAPKAAKPPR